MIKTPCEIVLWNVLPSLRRELVKTLAKKGIEREEIAKIFGITEAAICQYLKSKRGMNFQFSKNMLKTIEKIAVDMVNEPKRREEKFILGSCKICSMLKKEQLLCKLHKKENPLLLNCCLCQTR